MNYLTDKITMYRCPKCGRVAPAHGFGYDQYEGKPECEDCHEYATHEGDSIANWWSVAVYDCDRRYGGPEEGGWHYWAGELIHHAKIRFFDTLADAVAYQKELWTEYEGDRSIQIWGFSERMPIHHFPEQRPVYC